MDAVALFAKRTVLGTVGLGISGASVVMSFVDHNNEMALYLVDREIALRFKDPTTRDQVEAWILEMEGEEADEGSLERETILGTD